MTTNASPFPQRMKQQILTVFNIGNDKKCILSVTNQHIKIISNGLYDAENSALYLRN